MNLSRSPLQQTSIAPGTIAGALRRTADNIEQWMAELESAREIMTRQADRIAELEQLVGLAVEWPLRIALRPTQAKIFSMLFAASGPIGKSSLIAAMYGARPESEWPDNPDKIVHVHICGLRKAIEPHGVIIDTLALASGDCGYWLRPATRHAAAALIARPEISA